VGNRRARWRPERVLAPPDPGWWREEPAGEPLGGRGTRERNRDGDENACPFTWTFVDRARDRERDRESGALRFAAGVRVSEAPEGRLAPCVAVVGPANSGKTTLLHGLDAVLQGHASRPLVYVVKGSPDGTGRYLFHAPELRTELKSRVKGLWSETTVATVCGWIAECRKTLDLVVVDLGGRHAEGNAAILRCCTHFMVLARPFEDAEEERANGMASWVAACLASGLAPVAQMRSLQQAGSAEIAPVNGCLVGTFRGDAAAGDPTNAAVVTALADALLALCPRRAGVSYLDLRIGRDWEPADLADLGGLAGQVAARMGGDRPLMLGGRAPVWAYAAALHCALDIEPRAVVEVFDPKVPGGIVRIGAVEPGEADLELAASLDVSWRGDPYGGDEATLDLVARTADRFLPPPASGAVVAVPLPAGTAPSGPLVVSGAVPIWLHLAYSRLLRSLPGTRSVGVWDARRRAAMVVYRRAPR
jgi:hypothetical protein